MVERYKLPEPSDDELVEAKEFLKNEFPGVYVDGTLDEIFPTPPAYAPRGRVFPLNHKELTPYPPRESYDPESIESWREVSDDALRLHTQLSDQDS